jgi:chromosome segregation ATPase
LELVGKIFNAEKLSALLRYARALGGEEREMSELINGVLRKISGLKGELAETERRGEPTNSLKDRLKQCENRRSKLEAQRSDIQRRRADAGGLANNCLSFLKEQGIDFDD